MRNNIRTTIKSVYQGLDVNYFCLLVMILLLFPFQGKTIGLCEIQLLTQHSFFVGANGNPGSRPVAFITGGSAGIGKALAIEYAKRGYDLSLSARRAGQLDEVAREITEMFPEASVLGTRADVRNEDELYSQSILTRAYLKSVNVVIANAGVAVSGNLSELSDEEFRFQFDVNVFGLRNTIRAVHEDLLENRGKIGLIGSVNGIVAFPNSGAYGASKAAVRAMADSWHGEYAPHGVSVTHILPGFTETEFRQRESHFQNTEARAENDRIPTFLRQPVAVAARKIVNAIESGRRQRILTFHGNFGVFLEKYFPRLAAFFKIKIEESRLRNREQDSSL